MGLVKIGTADDALLRESLPAISEDANKYDRGRLFLAAGSYGMAGAAILSARAALRVGTGYLDLAVPKEIYGILASAVPEAVFTVYDPEDPDGSAELLREHAEKADAAALGPGLSSLRALVCPAVIGVSRKKLLLDADALNWIAGTKTEFLTPETVLTPHAGEMARLLRREAPVTQEERFRAVRQAAGEYRAVVLLKGKDTLIARPGAEAGEIAEGEVLASPIPGIFRNPSGTRGLSRAGSGDVLTGVIGAFLASGMDAFHAAVLGAYVHGKAGEEAEKRFGLRSMLPSDTAELVGFVIREAEAGPARK